MEIKVSTRPLIVKLEAFRCLFKFILKIVNFSVWVVNIDNMLNRIKRFVIVVVFFFCLFVLMMLHMYNLKC